MSGRIVLIGSGETAPNMVAVHRAGMKAASTDRAVVIDSTYGFQENVDQMTAKLAGFFETSLVARVQVASLRRPGSPGVESERFLATIRAGRYVFAGPGSPSYALSVWDGIPIAAALSGVVAAGGTVCLASAAALASGKKTLPVYEIYKVGSEPHWLGGLGLLAAVGLPLTVVSHWNNAEGGGHDTSRCYIGKRRFEELRRQLDHGVLGIDEHTAVTIDGAARTLSVSGVGSATILGESMRIVGSGQSLGFEEILEVAGSPVPAPDLIDGPAPAGDLEEALAAREVDRALDALLALEEEAAGDPGRRPALRAGLVRLVDGLRDGFADPLDQIGPLVEMALRARTAAREDGRYEESDEIRAGLLALGIEVRDTAAGVEWSVSESR